jgi:hypothetical protein
VLAASEWYTYKVVKDYVEGPVKDLGGLDRADEVVFLADRGWMLALLAAGVVFIVLSLGVARCPRSTCAIECGNRP